MSKPLIHGTRGFVSASLIMETIGESLTEIKNADRLTFADVGGALGKSDDQAAKYCEGSAMMSVEAFLRACEKWDGRFANPVYALFGLHLAESSAPDASAIQQQLLAMMQLVPSMHQALMDGDIDDDEIVAMQPTFETVGMMIDALRARYAEAMERRAALRGG